jgi:hypothetical protein
MKNLLKSSLALALVLLASSVAAHAVLPVPEIDANVGIGALTLIAGATAILRSRKR